MAKASHEYAAGPFRAPPKDPEAGPCVSTDNQFGGAACATTILGGALHDTAMTVGERSRRLAALRIALSEALRYSMAEAWVVRSEVCRKLLEGSGGAALHRIFDAARQAASAEEPASGAALRAALAAATEAEADPAVPAVGEVVTERVAGAMSRITTVASAKAAADAFAGRFGDAAVRLSRGGGGPSRTGFLETLNSLRRAACVFPEGYPWGGAEEEARRLGGPVAEAAASRALDTLGRKTALTAAATGTFTAAIRDIRGTGFRRVARDLAGNVAPMARELEGVSDADAAAIPSGVFVRSARECPDGAGAAMAADLLSQGKLAERVSDGAARSTFDAVYGAFVGGAYLTFRDGDLFGSLYDGALVEADPNDPQMDPAAGLDETENISAEEFAAIRQDVWIQCKAFGGRSISEWVDEARATDYRAAAASPGYAGLLGIYRASYEASYEAAVRKASSMETARR